MFQGRSFTATDLLEVGKVDDIQSNTARKTLKLYRPKTNFNTVLMFKYSKCLSIFIKVQMKCFFLFPNLKEQQKSGRLPFTVS